MGESFQPHPDPQKGERAGDWVIKSLERGDPERFPVSTHTKVLKTPGHRPLPPPPHLVLCISSIWQLLSHNSYNKPAVVNKLLSWIIWVVLTNYQTWERGCAKPWFIASVSEIQVARDLVSYLKRGQALGIQLFHLQGAERCSVCFTQSSNDPLSNPMK